MGDQQAEEAEKDAFLDPLKRGEKKDPT
jgi:hypothetical protein